MHTRAYSIQQAFRKYASTTTSALSCNAFRCLLRWNKNVTVKETGGLSSLAQNHYPLYRKTSSEINKKVHISVFAEVTVKLPDEINCGVLTISHRPRIVWPRCKKSIRSSPSARKKHAIFFNCTKLARQGVIRERFFSSHTVISETKMRALIGCPRSFILLRRRWESCLRWCP